MKGQCSCLSTEFRAESMAMLLGGSSTVLPMWYACSFAGSFSMRSTSLNSATQTQRFLQLASGLLQAGPGPCHPARGKNHPVNGGGKAYDSTYEYSSSFISSNS